MNEYLSKKIKEMAKEIEEKAYAESIEDNTKEAPKETTAVTETRVATNIPVRQALHDEIGKLDAAAGQLRKLHEDSGIGYLAIIADNIEEVISHLKDLKLQAQIPAQTQVAGQTYTVSYPETIRDEEGDAAGINNVFSGEIEIANTVLGKPQSPDCMFNTYLHELTHVILYNMGEYRLHDSERFVSTFAGYLTEAMKNAKY